MDGNSYPHRTSDEIARHLLWAQVDDPVHYQHRTIVRDGKRVSDTQPSEILTGGKHVYIDLAHHAGTVLGQREALTPTASLTRTDQGPAQRIDWILSTPNLVPAVRSVEVAATEEVSQWTDHGFVIARFGLADLKRILTPGH
ncbi:hypothetical protein ACIQVL_05315 [Streptomyces sp. NPDC090499]|uniref:hypothetical protein n=1 Tax=Streptomyces sp. NPDC090499 TaxID=3365965 RepID=UPI0037F17EE7